MQTMQPVFNLLALTFGIKPVIGQIVGIGVVERRCMPVNGGAAPDGPPSIGKRVSASGRGPSSRRRSTPWVTRRTLCKETSMRKLTSPCPTELGPTSGVGR